MRAVVSCFVLVVAATNAFPQQPAPAPDELVISENYVLAAVNSEVVTSRDVLIQWKLEGRRDANPERSLVPNERDRRVTAKAIVMDRLWIAHAKMHPLYAEVVKPRDIDEEAKGIFGALFDDPTVSDDERQFMRRAGEARIALSIALSNDPQFQRCSKPRPADIRKWYDTHPDQRRVPTTVELGRVLLGRESAKELYGEAADTLVLKIRQRAIELGSLEAAARELAAGSYQPMRVDDVDRESSLRDDVLEFAKSGQPGDLSAPIVGASSVMLYSLIQRREGRELTFDEVSNEIERRLKVVRQNFRMEQYFVTRLLPEAFFKPDDLFDDEIEKFYPRYKLDRERANAAAAKSAGAAATPKK